MAAPGLPEIVVILLIVVLFAAFIGGFVWVVKKISRSTQGSDAHSTAPADQQPPPGYWWDGRKWNPPGEAP